MPRTLSLAAVAALLAVGLTTLAAPDARADSWRYRHYGWHDGWHHHDGVRFGTTIIYGAPLYPAPPPRVIYVQPAPLVVESPGYANPGYAVPQYDEPRYGEPQYGEPSGGSSYLRADSGRYCREVNKVVTIGGHRQNAWGKACLQPDGSWEFVGD
ncbi:hypothetical protein SAMN06265365_10392 [Tistlia consotensis]|uniref:Surface antigen n=1 Tax=Tistlia consotensis USBA 355 TaxID=560819 RepID=A0A1Y6BN17_9PROT|nr:hypothetical protein [Tistlia consotensis]SMF18013.1 hypothetical protein SAMN05428998_106133 [Tistlia consotensis USBA 355]SNR40015.1 hypothetical protein SAMN06265365_10392 [Tistlia consotensis]